MPQSLSWDQCGEILLERGKKRGKKSSQEAAEATEERTAHLNKDIREWWGRTKAKIEKREAVNLGYVDVWLEP